MKYMMIKVGLLEDFYYNIFYNRSRSIFYNIPILTLFI